MPEDKTTVGDILTACLTDLKRAGISDLIALSPSEREELLQSVSPKAASSVSPLMPRKTEQAEQTRQAEQTQPVSKPSSIVIRQPSVEIPHEPEAAPIIAMRINETLNESSAINGTQVMARSKEGNKNSPAMKQPDPAVSSVKGEITSGNSPVKERAVGKESCPKGGADAKTIPSGIVTGAAGAVGAGSVIMAGSAIAAGSAVGADPTGKFDRQSVLRELSMAVSQCNLCRDLAANRTKTVFGSGNPNAELVFLGEGPGADEDRQGLPFVGRCGQLLTDIITKGMKIRREDVFICNIVRCRPPGNRVPLPDEAANCRRFLDATLQVIAPKYICCLGATAAVNLLDIVQPIGKFRGKVYDYKGAKVICTYHPAYLLRCPAAKAQTWEDIKVLMRMMSLPVQG